MLPLSLLSLRPLIRPSSVPTFRPWSRNAAALSTKRPANDPYAQDSVSSQNAKILRVVEKQIAERANLVKQLSPDMSTSLDISCSRRIKELEPLQAAWDDWTRTRQSLAETTSLLTDSDPTMRALASDEHASLTAHLTHLLSSTFPALLLSSLSSSPSSSSTTSTMNALMELKPGVGGSESSLFLSELLRMYSRYAANAGWSVKILTQNRTDEGGVKDAVVEFHSNSRRGEDSEGGGPYGSLRWESGVHRVQRVPATEASGRVHTSTVAIVVLPLVEDAEPAEGDDLFKMEDVKIEVMRARGAGGQHVNKTESAVRLTHIPTGITVSMQDERSQHQNKRRAFQILRARLMDIHLTKEVAARRDARRSLVRTADRSEKIRTYNYAQDRVTDHRLGLSLMNLESVLEGNALETFIEALRKKDREEMLEIILEEHEE